MLFKRLVKLFRPESPSLHRKELGIDFISPIGINLEDRKQGIYSIPYLLDATYSFAITDIPEIDKGIEILKEIPRETNIIAHLNKKRNTFNGAPKSLEASFALLYDFVDAFIVSDFVNVEELEPLLDLRLFQNEYRPIIIEIPEDYGTVELDEVIAFALLNSIDGLMLRNPRLINYAHKKTSGYLCIIADGVKDEATMQCFLAAGASLVTVPHSQRRYFSLVRCGKYFTRALIANEKTKSDCL